MWLCGSFLEHRAFAKTKAFSQSLSNIGGCQGLPVGAREMSDGKRCLGATGQHGCLFSFDSGVYDRMWFPYIRCLPLVAWQEGNRTENNDLAPRQVMWLCGSFLEHHAFAKTKAFSQSLSNIGNCQGLPVSARETSNGKRCLGRPGSTDAYSPSIPGYMTGCGFHIFLLATHGVARRKYLSANMQGREHLQKKPPTARERKAHQTVRWLTPYRSASEPDNFSRYISYL